MTSTKEYFDLHVVGEDNKPDWNDMNEVSSASGSTVHDEAVRPGNLKKWEWKGLDGKIPHYTAKKIFDKGIYFSTTPSLVNPYTGHSLGVKMTQLDNPYYVVVSNNQKDPAYYATTCPQEYVAIMKVYSNSFVEKSGGYKNWEERVARYNKKYPRNQF
jgi:hypothetical protein